MNKFFASLVLIIIGASVLYFAKPVLFAQSNTEIESFPEIELQIETRIEEHTVTDEDTFTTVMDALGIDYVDALEIVESAKEVVDFTHIKAGKVFRLVYEEDTPTRVEYEPGTETMIVVDLTKNYLTTEEPIPYDISVERADVVITESLFVAGLDAGLSEVLLLDFVDVFAWEVDFATQVQSGDSFSLLYEKRSRNGNDVGVGDILFGSFTNVGETSYAYRFIDSSDSISYYNQDGDSLVREFLKAPLNFSRISSGYTTARFHPVLKTTMPHRAIDYAAAYGTPVKAVSDGKVTFAGWNGGSGNFIDIRHNSIYETQYAHLSRIAVQQGESVKQGDIIGYVGSTGLSTGPHLHYQVKVNGQLTNPLEVVFPKGDPIPEDEVEEFYKQKDNIDQIFNSSID